MGSPKFPHTTLFFPLNHDYGKVSETCLNEIFVAMAN